jgi:hypothetical protein
MCYVLMFICGFLLGCAVTFVWLKDKIIPELILRLERQGLLTLHRRKAE